MISVAATELCPFRHFPCSQSVPQEAIFPRVLFEKAQGSYTFILVYGEMWIFVGVSKPPAAGSGAIFPALKLNPLLLPCSSLATKSFFYKKKFE